MGELPLETTDDEELARRTVRDLFLNSFLHESKNGLRIALCVIEDLERRAARDRPIQLEELGRAKDRIQSAMNLLTAFPIQDRVPQPSDVNEVARRAVHLVRAQAQGIALRLDFDPAIPKLLIDASELMVLFDGLLSNAVRAIKETTRHGTISISTSIDRRHDIPMVVIRIEDDGVGIAREHLSQIRELSFSTWGQPGYGLALIDRIVNARGGSLHVESTLSVHTAVTVKLPLRRYQSETP